MKFTINSGTESDDYQSDSAKLKSYLYYFNHVLYDYVKKLIKFMPNSVTELMVNLNSVLNKACMQNVFVKLFSFS